MIRMIKEFINNLKDFFRPFEPEVLACYQHKIPDSVDVAIKSDGKKYIAKILIKSNKDTLFTQASDKAELEEMVNDAVATYYEIPSKYSKMLLISKRYQDPTLIKAKALKVA